MSNHGKITAFVREMLKRPVAFHPMLARIGGSAHAGLMLSQAIYWTERTSDPEGWFFKTIAEWEEEIYLTRWEQETTRKALRERGLIREQKRLNPMKLHFRVDMEAVALAISQLVGKQHAGIQHAENQHVENQQVKDKTPETINMLENNMMDSNMRKSDMSACGKTTRQHVGKSHVIKEAETTTETTSETTGSAASSAAPAPGVLSLVLSLPLNTGKEFPITQKTVDELAGLYPAVDVMQQLRNMKGWLMGNPSNRKTKTGVMRFVHRWLAKEQDSAAPVAPSRKGKGVNNGVIQRGQIAAQEAQRIVSEDEQRRELIERLGGGDIDKAKVAHQHFRDSMEKAINKHSFETWFKPLKPLVLTDSRVLHLLIPTPEFMHIAERYAEQITAWSERTNVAAVKLHFLASVQ